MPHIAQKLINVSYSPMMVHPIINMYSQLNLNPSFQRKSVWSIRDRKKFIQTVLEGMPCPTIFLFKHWDKGKKKWIHDVLDGKQRLETILLFYGKLKPKKLSIEPEQRKKIREWLKADNFAVLDQYQQQAFLAFNIPVGHMELKDASDGSEQGMGDVIEAFVRINTQGRPLSKQETRSALYGYNPYLDLARGLRKKLLAVFRMSADQQARMKDIEIVLELLITIHKNEILNKKLAIEEVLKQKDLKNKVITKTKSKFIKVLDMIKKLDLGTAPRFSKKTSDFYSLFAALIELEKLNCVFQRPQYEASHKVLTAFSTEVAKLMDANQKKDFAYLKKMAGTTYGRYWQSTQANTDAKPNRMTRHDILKDILLRVVKKQKDKKRFFTDAQKEQIWAKSAYKKCSFPGCQKKLTWETATIDHVIAWSLGGPTDVSNGQLLCRKHNSMKKDKDFERCLLQA